MPHLVVTLERKSRNIRSVHFHIYEEGPSIYSYFLTKEGEWIHPWYEEGEEFEIEFELYPKYGRRIPLRRIRWYRIKMKSGAPKFTVRLGTTVLTVENAEVLEKGFYRISQKVMVKI